MLVGSRRLLTAAGVDIAPLTAALEPLEAAGKTAILAAVAGRAAGVIGIADTIRPGRRWRPCNGPGWRWRC
ncbi:MAG: hypothetical protein HQL80_05405 [Magnetococcales bacterium]|nr:hypothetical protein [Magnetococcales bacterium]